MLAEYAKLTDDDVRDLEGSLDRAFKLLIQEPLAAAVQAGLLSAGGRWSLSLYMCGICIPATTQPWA